MKFVFSGMYDIKFNIFLFWTVCTNKTRVHCSTLLTKRLITTSFPKKQTLKKSRSYLSDMKYLLFQYIFNTFLIKLCHILLSYNPYGTTDRACSEIQNTPQVTDTFNKMAEYNYIVFPCSLKQGTVRRTD